MARKFRNEKWDIKEMLAILKEELEPKERSIAVGSSFHDTLRKTILPRLYNKTAKNLQKSHVFFIIGTIMLQINF